ILKRNRNVVIFRAEHSEAASAYVVLHAGLRGRAARVNEALTTLATWLRQQHDCGTRARPDVRVAGYPCHVNDLNGRSSQRGKPRSTSRSSAFSRALASR